MNVSIGAELEKLVEDQVSSGFYQNQSEVVRDALRHAFWQNDADDTELLAAKLREAKDSPRAPYVRGEFRKMATRMIAEKRRRAKAA